MAVHPDLHFLIINPDDFRERPKQTILYARRSVHDEAALTLVIP